MDHRNDQDVAAAAAAAAAATFLQQHQEEAGETSRWSQGYTASEIPKQTGKFTKNESEIVQKAVESFCATKQISVARLCSECDHKAELKGAWMEIAKCLPHRSVQSVYRHGIRRCHPFKRGSWSEAESDLLIGLVQSMGKKWSAIQNKLNRSADSCRDKYREMSDEFVKGRWREDETKLLVTCIREQLQADPCSSIKELSKIVLERGIQISWSVVSKRMGNRSRLSCFKKWQKLSGMSTCNDMGDGVMSGPPSKRLKHCHDTIEQAEAAEFDVYSSAKMAAATVEAVELPDTQSLSVREGL